MKILDQTLIQPSFVMWLKRSEERAAFFWGSGYRKLPPQLLNRRASIKLSLAPFEKERYIP